MAGLSCCPGLCPGGCLAAGYPAADAPGRPVNGSRQRPRRACRAQGPISRAWQLALAGLAAALLVLLWRRSGEGRRKLPVYHVDNQYRVVNVADELNKTV